LSAIRAEMNGSENAVGFEVESSDKRALPTKSSQNQYVGRYCDLLATTPTPFSLCQFIYAFFQDQIQFSSARQRDQDLVITRVEKITVIQDQGRAIGIGVSPTSFKFSTAGAG
jgi:hypothetical protein